MPLVSRLFKIPNTKKYNPNTFYDKQTFKEFIGLNTMLNMIVKL